MDCIFCKIVAGEIPAHKVWEDEKHLAFLSIFPNTDGFTVVIPKSHYSSYCFANDDTVLSELVLASKKVALKIDRAFDDVGRTGLIFEGFGVDHLHAKLAPMHGTKDSEWKKRVSAQTKFFEKYEGYLSSHDCAQASAEKLAEVAERIRKA